MAWYHVMPSIAILFLPFLLILTIACSLSVAYCFPPSPSPIAISGF